MVSQQSMKIYIEILEFVEEVLPRKIKGVEVDELSTVEQVTQLINSFDVILF
jgi:hypothetical protein